MAKIKKAVVKKAVRKSVLKAAKKAVKKTALPASGTEAVNEYMKKLTHPLKAEIEAVRSIILKADPNIEERVKWNAPSFFYKKDFAAFHLRPQEHVHLVLIFPEGLVKDDSGLLEGDYKDRRMAYFYNMKDVQSKKAALQKVVKDWIKLIDK